jgi:predicted site-specific integrase-resolvase
MPLDGSRPTLSTTQAGLILGVKHETVKQYWQRGLIEGYLTIPGKHGRLRLYRDSVEEYDRKRKSSPSLSRQ